MVYSLLISLQILVAIGLIALILLQQGKGADAGAAFGSGASSTVFGARGSASFLTRMTALFAFVFLANSLLLAMITSRTVERPSLVDQIAAPVPTAPAPASDVPADVPEDLMQALESALPEGVDIDVVPGAADDVPDMPSQDADAGDLPPPEDEPGAAAPTPSAAE